MKHATVLLVFEELQDLEKYGSLLCTLGYSIRMCNSGPKESKPLRRITSL